MKTYVSNDTANPMFVHGTMIQPGEGREVDDGVAPQPAGQTLPSEPLPDLQANLHDMLAQPLKSLLPVLPDLSDETLAELAAIEGEKDDARKTLLTAIGELQLERARAKAADPT